MNAAVPADEMVVPRPVKGRRAFDQIVTPGLSPDPEISCSDTPAGPETHFAPAVRSGHHEVCNQRAAFLSDRIGVELLEAMPGPALVLNARRQIVAANRLLLSLLRLGSLDGVLSLRPGEALGCIHAAETPHGCGTSEACARCGAAHAIMDTLHTHARSTRECRITTSAPGGALDVRVHTTFLSIAGEEFVVLGMEDISSEKRRQVLERVFLHDLINLCAGLHGIAALLEQGVDTETEATFKHDLARLSELVIDEISAHREMDAAERGELVVHATTIDVAALFGELSAAYRFQPVARDRPLRFTAAPITGFHCDPVILRRILGNLIKNALEASQPGDIVSVACAEGEGGPTFSVNNPGVMPRDVQLQIFQRSFSTKGTPGRGIGTYSVRMLGEKYLGGKVTFISTSADGTTFCLALPWRT